MEITHKEGEYIVKKIKYFLPRCIENSNVKLSKFALYRLCCKVYLKEGKMVEKYIGKELSLVYIDDNSRDLENLEEDLKLMNDFKSTFVWYPCSSRKKLL